MSWNFKLSKKHIYNCGTILYDNALETSYDPQLLVVMCGNYDLAYSCNSIVSSSSP